MKGEQTSISLAVDFASNHMTGKYMTIQAQIYGVASCQLQAGATAGNKVLHNC